MEEVQINRGVTRRDRVDNFAVESGVENREGDITNSGRLCVIQMNEENK